jgi:hypothetical protein
MVMITEPNTEGKVPYRVCRLSSSSLLCDRVLRKM